MQRHEHLRIGAFWILTVVSLLFAIRESWLSVMLMFCSFLCLEKACSLMKETKQSA